MSKFVQFGFGIQDSIFGFSTKNLSLVCELYFGNHIVFNRWKKTVNYRL